jgi:hypothetical protein
MFFLCLAFTFIWYYKVIPLPNAFLNIQVKQQAEEAWILPISLLIRPHCGNAHCLTPKTSGVPEQSGTPDRALKNVTK